MCVWVCQGWRDITVTACHSEALLTPWDAFLHIHTVVLLSDSIHVPTDYMILSAGFCSLYHVPHTRQHLVLWHYASFLPWVSWRERPCWFELRCVAVVQRRRGQPVVSEQVYCCWRRSGRCVVSRTTFSHVMSDWDSCVNYPIIRNHTALIANFFCCSYSLVPSSQPNPSLDLVSIWERVRRNDDHFQLREQSMYHVYAK